MNTIHPISTSSLYFGRAKKAPQPQYVKRLHTNKELETEKNRSFLTGALCAAVILGAVDSCQKADREAFIDNMEMHINHTNMEDKKIKVIDLTGDDVPDFVIEDKDGTQNIFDIKNGNIYYKDEYEFEKIR